MFLLGSYRAVNHDTRSIPPPSLRVDDSQADLDDLAARLARTRLPPRLPATTGTSGTPNHYLREMVAHWRTLSTGASRRRG